MTEDIVQQISLNQIIIAILQEHGPITVPTLSFLNASSDNKELVMDYDEDGPSFTFSLRDKNEQQ